MDWLLYIYGCIHVFYCMVDAGRTSKVVVKSDIGPLQGIKVLSGSSEVAVFRGIPYAKPPTGSQRFEPPEPVLPWKDVFIASGYGSVCIQSSTIDNKTFIGDEDCLTLNIFKPMLFLKENRNIPVIVMIHSGNFISGSGNYINGVELAKTLDAVIVTMNYRLGIFGFYSMSGHIKENLGILDQIAALKWIKNNIKDFSGNPDNILLVADQIMASVHLMSPRSRYFFNRAISYDGESYLNPIAGYNFNFENHRTRLENLCGSIKSTNNLPVEHIVWVCLRSAGIENLYNLSHELTEHLWHPFRPVYDGDVISIDSHIVTSFLHCDYLAFKSDLLIPMLTNRTENDTSCKEIFNNVVSNVSKERYRHNNHLLENVLQSYYFPQFSNRLFNFCKAVRVLLNDLMTSAIISLANHHSRTGLTFLNFVNFDVDGTSFSESSMSMQTTNIACILTNQNTASCQLPVAISAGINQVVRTFLYHGYPTVNPTVVWRPYTTTSKNYLQITDEMFYTGASSDWPAERIERLWLKTLPDVDVATLFSTDPDVKVIQQSVGMSWGLTEQQLEALIFSLVLLCLVLICVTLTLFRIVCFVNGKTFYTKKKAQPKKGVVLTDTKKKRDTTGSFGCKVFHTQESISLNRRTSEHADIDA
ncbi:Hypothetical predicted protein [Mytilus galloprovincialis]|nr:Hypothetical predicted protein [Mytilus galloprovincialis]